MSGVWGWLWWNDVWSGVFLIILHTNQANKLEALQSADGSVFFMVFFILVQFCHGVSFLQSENIFF